MKTLILIILSIIGVIYFIYWIVQIISRSSKAIYDLGYKNGTEDSLRFLETFEDK